MRWANAAHDDQSRHRVIVQSLSTSSRVDNENEHIANSLFNFTNNDLGTMALAPHSTTCTDVAIDPPNSPAQALFATLKPMCQLLIVTCVGSAMLVPLFVLLWFSSSRETRRKPIFIANMVSIVTGLALAGVSIAQMVCFWNDSPRSLLIEC